MASYTYNGVDYTFPDDSTKEERSAFFAKKDLEYAGKHPTIPSNAGIGPTDSVDKFRNYVGQPLTSSGGAIGGTIGSVLGSETGPGAIPIAGASAGLGSAVGNFIKGLAPRAFGSPSQTPLEDSAIDSVVAGALPEAAGRMAVPLIARSIAKASPAARTAMEANRTADQATGVREFLKPPLQENTEMAIKVRENELNPELQYPDFAHRNPVGAFEQNEIRQGVLERNRQAVKSHQETTDLINQGYSQSSGSLNPSKILDELKTNPGKYSNIDLDTRKNLTDFLEKATNTKPTKSTEQNVLRYVKNKFIFGLGVAAAGKLLGTPVAGALTGATLTIGEAGMKRLMSNPETVTLLKKAVETPILAPESGFVGALLTHALRGQEVILNLPEGGTQHAVVGPDGQLQYPAPNQK